MDKWIIVSKQANDDDMKWRPAGHGKMHYIYDAYEKAVLKCKGKYIANLANANGSNKMKYGIARVSEVEEIEITDEDILNYIRNIEE